MGNKDWTIGEVIYYHICQDIPDSGSVAIVSDWLVNTGTVPTLFVIIFRELIFGLRHTHYTLGRFKKTRMSAINWRCGSSRSGHQDELLAKKLEPWDHF